MGQAISGSIMYLPYIRAECTLRLARECADCMHRWRLLRLRRHLSPEDRNLPTQVQPLQPEQVGLSNRKHGCVVGQLLTRCRSTHDVEFLSSIDSTPFIGTLERLDSRCKN